MLPSVKLFRICTNSPLLVLYTPYSIIDHPTAMEILRKSNIDPNLLNALFAMADDDRDGRLTAKEFCVAFHLALCVT
jgi:Ca2+-binding EF-hand superfamily protein